METRRFGSSQDRPTVLGLGAAYLGKVSFAEGVATAREALNLGLTYIDTSPLYGPSQSILGEALGGGVAYQGPRIGEALGDTPEGFFQATKLGYFLDPRHFRSVDAIRSQLHESLRVLRRDYVDVIQIHECDWAIWWDDGASRGEHVDTQRSYDFANAPVMEVLREAKEKGWCRYFGITGNSAARTAHVLRHVDVDSYLLAGQYSALTRVALAEAIPLAREKGVAIVLATPTYPHLIDRHPEWIESPPSHLSPEMASQLARIYAIQAQAGMSLMELNLRWIVANPDVTALLSGAATTREIQQNVAAVEKGPLPPDLHRAVDDLIPS